MVIHQSEARVVGYGREAYEKHSAGLSPDYIRVPDSKAYWKNLPFLRGKLWSDNMIATMVK